MKGWTFVHFLRSPSRLTVYQKLKSCDNPKLNYDTSFIAVFTLTDSSKFWGKGNLKVKKNTRSLLSSAAHVTFKKIMRSKTPPEAEVLVPLWKFYAHRRVFLYYYWMKWVYFTQYLVFIWFPVIKTGLDPIALKIP